MSRANRAMVDNVGASGKYHSQKSRLWHRKRPPKARSKAPNNPSRQVGNSSRLICDRASSFKKLKRWVGNGTIEPRQPFAGVIIRSVSPEGVSEQLRYQREVMAEYRSTDELPTMAEYPSWV